MHPELLLSWSPPGCWHQHQGIASLALRRARQASASPPHAYPVRHHDELCSRCCDRSALAVRAAVRLGGAIGNPLAAALPVRAPLGHTTGARARARAGADAGCLRARPRATSSNSLSRTGWSTSTRCVAPSPPPPAQCTRAYTCAARTPSAQISSTPCRLSSPSLTTPPCQRPRPQDFMLVEFYGARPSKSLPRPRADPPPHTCPRLVAVQRPHAWLAHSTAPARSRSAVVWALQEAGAGVRGRGHQPQGATGGPTLRRAGGIAVCVGRGRGSQHGLSCPLCWFRRHRTPRSSW